MSGFFPPLLRTIEMELLDGCIYQEKMRCRDTGKRVVVTTYVACYR